METYPDLKLEKIAVYDYVRLNKHRLPDYWQEKGMRVCIDGICAMIARDKFTLDEIADFYECPVPLVEQIKKAYIGTINKYKKLHDECIDMFGDAYIGSTTHVCNDKGSLELLCRIFRKGNDR